MIVELNHMQGRGTDTHIHVQKINKIYKNVKMNFLSKGSTYIGKINLTWS